MINTESFYKEGVGVKRCFTYSAVFTKQPKGGQSFSHLKRIQQTVLYH